MCESKADNAQANKLNAQLPTPYDWSGLNLGNVAGDPGTDLRKPTGEQQYETTPPIRIYG